MNERPVNTDQANSIIALLRGTAEWAAIAATEAEGLHALADIIEPANHIAAELREAFEASSDDLHKRLMILQAAHEEAARAAKRLSNFIWANTTPPS
jgi:outer membrane murein-binding lipoprotein Lpp